MKKKAIISVFATIFFALTLTLFSYAATKTQDGLQVELTTDKSSYTSSDTISVTIKVTNTGTTAVSDLTLENTIPTGYTKTTNTSSTKSVSILLAGDEAMLTTSFVKDGSGTSSAGNTSGDSGGTSSGSSNASSGTSGTGGSSNSSSSGSGSGSGNSSSVERGTTNTTDGVTATNASNSSQSGDAYGAEDLTRGEGTTSATSGSDTTSGEVLGTGGDSSASDVNDDGASDDSTSLNEGESATSESAAISENENAYETVAGVEGSDIDRSSTGDGGVSPVAIAVGVIVVVGIAVAIVKIKSGKKLLSVLICVSVVSVFDGEMMLVVEAAEYKTIEVSKSIKIGSETVKVVGSVKYQVGGDEEELGEPLPMPESPTEDEEFLWKYFDIMDITNVSSSNTIQSESEVIDMLRERGFGDVVVQYNYSIDGSYQSDTDAVYGSNEKHPEYDATYKDGRGNIWTLFIVNGDIYANWLSYSIDNPYDRGIIISESNTITEYVDISSRYYELIPHSDYAIIKKVNILDAKTLDSIALEGIQE